MNCGVDLRAQLRICHTTSTKSMDLVKSAFSFDLMFYSA